MSQIACVGTIAGVLAASAASAAPLSMAPLREGAASVEKAEWVLRCWWRQTYWGPQQVCRQVWAPPRYPGYGLYGGGGDDWRWRHHHHHHHDAWDSDWR